jgi:hypothetical protein
MCARYTVCVGLVVFVRSPDLRGPCVLITSGRAVDGDHGGEKEHLRVTGQPGLGWDIESAHRRPCWARAGAFSALGCNSTSAMCAAVRSEFGSR